MIKIYFVLALNSRVALNRRVAFCLKLGWSLFFTILSQKFEGGSLEPIQKFRKKFNRKLLVSVQSEVACECPVDRSYIQLYRSLVKIPMLSAFLATVKLKNVETVYKNGPQTGPNMIFEISLNTVNRRRKIKMQN